MRASTLTTTMVAILIGAAIAAVAPALGQDPTGTADRAGPAAGGSGDEIALRRDGERAVAFDPVIGGEAQTALRRDGSSAAPFVAQVGPEATTSAAEGFDWGDAAIGAAAAVAVMLLASSAWLAVHRRRETRLRPGVAA